METNRAVLLAFLIFITFFSPGGNPSKIISSVQRQRLNRYFEQKAYGVEVLLNSTWESGYGNLTGLTKQYSGVPARPGSIIPKQVELAAVQSYSQGARKSNEHDKDLHGDDVRIPIDNNHAEGLDRRRSELYNNEHGDSDNGADSTKLVRRSKWSSDSHQSVPEYRSASGTYFSNVTATVEGKWVRDGSLNITGGGIYMPIPDVREWASMFPMEAFNNNNDTEHNNSTIDRDRFAEDDDDIWHPAVKPGNRSEDLGRFTLGLKETLATDLFTGYEFPQLSSSSNNASAYDPSRSNVSLLKLDFTLSDENGDSAEEFYLVGIRMRDTGNFVAATSSLKFAGRLAIPHFLPDSDLTRSFFEHSQSLMAHYVNRTLQYEKEDPFYGLLEEAEILAENCEFIAYGHVHSLDLTQDELNDIEEELRNPIGRPHKSVPLVNVDILMYSPDCGVVYRANNLEGEKNEHFFMRERWVIMGGILLLLFQTMVTAVQMRDTDTFSTISKISFYSMAPMALSDGFICVVTLLFSFLEATALPFLATTFISFSLGFLFELKYMLLIYQAQLMEGVADARASEASNDRFVARPDGSLALTTNSGNAVANTSAASSGSTAGLAQNDSNATDDINNTNSAPLLPVSQPRPTVETVDERQITGLVVSWYIVALLFTLTMSIIATTWPVVVRRVYEYLVLFCLYSFWLPQVYRNVMRGSRKSFTWFYILCTTVIRVIPLLYVTLVPHNVLDHGYDPLLAIVIVGWLWLQVLMLIAQSAFGPRFFVPSSWLPVLYDYHPIITQDELEEGLTLDGEVVSGEGPGGPSGGGGESGSGSPLLDSSTSAVAATRSFDCAICMTPVDLIIVPRNSSPNFITPSMMMARHQYMVTPCRHVFHTECMEHWMRTRLQCPVCRNPLPPI